MKNHQKRKFYEDTYLWVKINNLGVDYLDNMITKEISKDNNLDKIELIERIKDIISLENNIESEGFRTNNL